MLDLLAEKKEFTVSEISFAIKHLVETNFAYVRVKGEIFGAKRADSGHWYLSLKDENSLLAAVCWRGVANSLPIKIEDGVEVIASGKITTFNGRSSYQLVIEKLEIAGEGALLKLLEERKQKFLAEGLFAAEHKKKIPYLPQTIGVITSPTGAVIRDIIHRIRDRFPTRIIVWPTPVQGEGAAEKIAAAIKGFNDLPVDSPYKPDVLIVARGGGSLEDLWPFNEEIVVRAVYNSDIPLISAVGHETDTMLIDYAADLRAPTPTGAAEFAVPVKTELYNGLLTTDLRIKNAVFRYFNELKQYMEALGRGIPSLEQIVLENQQKIDDRHERLQLAFANLLKDKNNLIKLTNLKPFYIKTLLETKKENLRNLALRLESVSIDAVLKRGFAWVSDGKFQTLYNTNSAKKAQNLHIRFADGIVKARVTERDCAIQGDLFDNW
ncbi:MAG: exodeoxyribonuclease VII large subunit [Alphaproteobacteria bacterium]|nr:exodeoxyribonuclease VII large subunit [Alphaproteobacteria bacterium]